MLGAGVAAREQVSGHQQQKFRLTFTLTKLLFYFKALSHLSAFYSKPNMLLPTGDLLPVNWMKKPFFLHCHKAPFWGNCMCGIFQVVVISSRVYRKINIMAFRWY